MRRRNIMLSSIAALTLAGTNLMAESTKLDSVNVWETEVTSSSLNLGKSAIETKQADHLSDLLRDLPGVDVGGTHSINNRINIRGIQDENLEITLDGAKVQNANMFHHIGNLLINPDILKKADIQVGTNSVVNGSLGGAIAFETKDGKDMLEKRKDFGARIQTNYNSNNSLGGSLSLYGNVLEDSDFLIYHNYVSKKNWKDGEGEKTFGVEGKIQNTLLKFGHNINDTQRFSFSYDYLKDEGDYSPRPDFGKAYNTFATGSATFPTKYERDTITLKHNLNLGDNLILDTSVYSNKNELERTETWTGRTPRPTFSGLLKGNVKTVGLNTKAQSNIESGETLHTLTYGALYDVQSSEVTWDGAQYGKDEEAKSTAVFVENAIDFDNGLIVTPGIRFNHYDLDGSYGKIQDNKFTYGLAGEYAVNDDLTLLASDTTLYKGVEMVDVLASNRLNMSTTEDLKAESGINKEIGFRYIKDNVLGADSIGYSFKYFRTTIKDYIDTEWNQVNGAWAGTMVNSGELNLKGFESSFAYNKSEFNSLVTYARSSSNFEATGKPTSTEPGDSLSVGIDYKIAANLDLSWESLFMFSEDDVPSSSYNEKESYNVHDVALNWKPKEYKGLTVIAGIDNIFDKSYTSHTSEDRTVNGVSTADLEPGRNFKVTLAYKF